MPQTQKMLRFPILCALALAACSEQPAGRSEYFDTVQLSDIERETPGVNQNVIVQLPQNNQVPFPVITEQQRPPSDEALITNLNRAIEDAERGELSPVETQSTQVASAPTPNTGTTTQTSQTGVQLPAPSSDTISDNSFSTVAASRTIESDRELTQSMANQTVVLEAKPVPQVNPEVNLAAFARSTSHKLGQRVYQRAGRSNSVAKRQCRKYPNPDAAQRAFLAAGGPATDRMDIDPDGDGFVCGWSPIPYRNLSVGGN